MTSTIGTGGQIFTPVDKAVYNPLLNTHTFCNIMPDTWYVMGAILSAGLALRWLKENILYGQDFGSIDEAAAAISAGSDGMIFLPYLTGERTPHMDANARGIFYGLTLKHNRGHMSRAVMEGVTFALRECMETVEQLGIPVEKVVASGGGARSRLWLQLQADVLGREIYTTKMAEQACTGAAMAAGIGCGVYRGIEDACEAVVRMNEAYVEPNEKNEKLYDRCYKVYKQLYTMTAPIAVKT